MKILENVSLKSFNTFSLEVKARYFLEINKIKDLHAIFAHPKLRLLPRLVLGGGSNVLFTKDFEGLILKINLKGREILEENNTKIIIKVSAGEIWHDLVCWAVDQGFGGLENLSLIPGTVGAAPIQNIGAYGVELKDSLVALQVYEIANGKLRDFSREDCQLGYRDSIFKNEWKDQYIILSVSLILQKKDFILNISYGMIKKELENMHVTQPTIKTISQAVINIRKSKLADPAKIGNGGSFFKNPTVMQQYYEKLIVQYPDIISYPVSENQVKLAAGQLIEKTDWKGKRLGQIGIYEKQALVLVNYGVADGRQIYALSEKVIQDVQKKFGITLEREVLVV
ncbi:MAG: UDP-N-acetylmuramate dehydrogenase [Flavobacteriales bacterium AspAUS03]